MKMMYMLLFFACKDKFLPLRTFFLPLGTNLLFLIIKNVILKTRKGKKIKDNKFLNLIY